jgi:GAF domain-containing protein/anti-sigma regulatory factor (Ser/Thr protein kinase)
VTDEADVPAVVLPAAVPPAVTDLARLRAVQETGLLDTPAEQAFDRLASLAAELLQVPFAFVTLVDDTRSYGKACVGVPQGSEQPVSASFCQYVIDEDGALVVDDARTDARSSANPTVTVLGVQAWAGFPLRGPTGHVLGSFCVLDLVPRTWSDRDVAVMTVLAEAASAHVSLAAAAVRDRRSREQLRRLAQASDLLLSSQDPVQVLQRMTQLAVPDLAVYCTALVPSRDGTELVPAVTAGPYGGQTPWPSVDPAGPAPSAVAFRTGEAQAVADLTALLSSYAPSSPASALTSFVQGGPTYSVPLRAQGQTLGVMTLLRRRGDPPFDPEDEEFARQLAGRTASALLVTRRHEQERQIAEVLQRSMLSTLPVLPELDLHGYYRPAGGTTHIGGDWYDAVDLGAGRTALVIGDVMGRGMRAAAVMGQLRTAARTLARLDLPPQQVLGLLDELVDELDDGQIVTCFYGVHDPASGTLTWCSAGHPPPVVRRATGTGRLPGEPGAPLGVGVPAHAEHRDPLLPGDVLCLFTDGLIEDRSRDLDVGLGEVERLLAGDWTDLPGLAEQLVAEVAAGEEDDVALLLVRVADRAPTAAGGSTSRVLDLDLDGGPEVVATARHWARAAVLAWHGPAGHVETVALITSELVTNAVRHAAPPVRLRLRAAPGAVYVEVFDDAHHSPQVLHGDLDDESGRGMVLVDAVAHRWGSRASGRGKVVWAEVLVEPVATEDGDWSLPQPRESD